MNMVCVMDSTAWPHLIKIENKSEDPFVVEIGYVRSNKAPEKTEWEKDTNLANESATYGYACYKSRFFEYCKRHPSY